MIARSHITLQLVLIFGYLRVSRGFSLMKKEDKALHAAVLAINNKAACMAFWYEARTISSVAGSRVLM
jgi:hypothetical protein